MSCPGSTIRAPRMCDAGQPPTRCFSSRRHIHIRRGPLRNSTSMHQTVSDYGRTRESLNGLRLFEGIPYGLEASPEMRRDRAATVCRFPFPFRFECLRSGTVFRQSPFLSSFEGRRECRSSIGSNRQGLPGPNGVLQNRRGRSS